MEGQEHKQIVKIIANALEQEGYCVEIEKLIGKLSYDLVATKPDDCRKRFVEVYVNRRPPRYKEPKKPNIKCEHCDREWFTKSKLKRVTCPNCGKKTPVNPQEAGE